MILFHFNTYIHLYTYNLYIRLVENEGAVIVLLRGVYGANNFYMCKMPGGGRKKLLHEGRKKV